MLATGHMSIFSGQLGGPFDPLFTISDLSTRKLFCRLNLSVFCQLNTLHIVKSFCHAFLTKMHTQCTITLQDISMIRKERREKISIMHIIHYLNPINAEGDQISVFPQIIISTISLVCIYWYKIIV